MREAREACPEFGALLTADAFASEDLSLLVRKKVDLAVHVAAIQRQEVVRVGLTRHAVNPKVPNHLDGAVLELMRMQIRRAKLDVQIGRLSADPPCDDVVPGLVRPGDIPFCRVLALSRTIRRE